MTTSRSTTSTWPAALALGARRATSLVLGTVAAGLVVGAAAREAGLTLSETAAMSGLVYAGTAQLTALSLWSRDPAALPFVGILLATLVVNLRNLLLGAAVAPWLRSASAREVYPSMFFLSEEAWALTAAERERAGEGRVAAAAFLAGVGVVLWTAWVASSVTGHAMAALVRDPEWWALDFAGTASILVLLTMLWRGRADAPGWAVAAAVSLVAHRLLPGQWYILLGAFAGCVAGARVRPADRQEPADAR